MPEQFKLAFPSATLPENRGGGRCVVIFSMANPQDRSIAFAWCIDDKGRVHQQVPFKLSDLQGAKPMVLVEDPNAQAPRIGGRSGLIGADGQPL